ncbi:hypothetical protein ACOJBO_08200 [Rhizobium beringeri]
MNLSMAALSWAITICRSWRLGIRSRRLSSAPQAITKELQNAGMVVVREDLNAEPVFYAQLPGNFSYIARRADLVTELLWSGVLS